jgi:hypothetical protein
MEIEAELNRIYLKSTDYWVIIGLNYFGPVVVIHPTKESLWGYTQVSWWSVG